MYLTSLQATSPYFNMNSYDLFFNPDQNTNITKFNTGKFYFRPSSTYNDGKLNVMNKPVYMSMSVRYTGESEWVNLLPDLEEQRSYTADELGLDTTKKVETIWIHFHNGSTEKFVTKIDYNEAIWQKIPSGLTNTSMYFYTNVDEGYTGSVESTMGLAYAGWDAEGYLSTGKSKYVPEDIKSKSKYIDFGSAWESRLSPKTAQVVEKPEGISRFVKSHVSLEQSENGIVRSGDNQLYFDLMSDAASINPMNGPFISYALIDNDIEISDPSLAINGTVEIVDDNYKGRNQTLVKITYYVGFIPMNRYTRVYLPVNIKENSKYKLDIQLYGYLNEDFEVASTANLDGTITKKLNDEYDFNENGITDEFIYATSNSYMYRSAYEFSASTSIGEEGLNTVEVTKGDNQKNIYLNVKNVKGNPIKDLVLIGVLPSLDDTFVLSDDARDSKFNMVLSNEIILPQGYEDYFTVYYSTSKEPRINGVIDTNVSSDLSGLNTLELVDDQEWYTIEQIVDMSKVRSYKIVKNDNSNSIYEDGLSFGLSVSMSENALTGEEDIADRIAYSSYAVAINNASAIESRVVSFVFTKADDSKEPEKPSIPNKPEPEEPEIPSNPDLEEPSKPGTGNETELPKDTIDPTLPNEANEDPKELVTPKEDSNSDAPKTSVDMRAPMYLVLALGSLCLAILTYRKRTLDK